jgi:hypothetical protein
MQCMCQSAMSHPECFSSSTATTMLCISTRRLNFGCLLTYRFRRLTRNRLVLIGIVPSPEKLHIKISQKTKQKNNQKNMRSKPHAFTHKEGGDTHIEGERKREHNLSPEFVINGPHPHLECLHVLIRSSSVCTLLD